jgi:hypothetical protein
MNKPTAADLQELRLDSADLIRLLENHHNAESVSVDQIKAIVTHIDFLQSTLNRIKQSVDVWF